MNDNANANANAVKIDEEVVVQPGEYELASVRFLSAFRAAVQHHGYANEDAFFKHLYGEGEVILRHNGVTFRIVYQMLNHSDDNRIFVTSEDWPEWPGFDMFF